MADSEMMERGSDADLPAMSFRGYDPAYPAVFERLAERIRSVLPSVRVEHVGSTSVPGLGGRPVLDVVVSEDPVDQERVRAALLAIGFTDFPWAHIRPMLRAELEHGEREYRVLLYVLPSNHEYVTGWISFRDYMRSHSEEIERYQGVKRAAIAAGQTHPWSYQQAKTPYLRELSRRIASEP